MNQRKAKALRRKAYDLAAVYLRTLLPKEEGDKVTPASVKLFEQEQERHVFTGDSIRLAPYSSRWFLQRLKKLDVDFRLSSPKELGIDA